jgi:cell division septal protein FtsQ
MKSAQSNNPAENSAELRTRLLSQLAVTALIICGLLVMALRWKMRQQVDSLSVSGVKAIRAEEILALAAIHEQDSTAEQQAQLAAIKSRVLRHPYVQDVIVQRAGIRGINIQVKERQPVIAIPVSSGRIDYVDSNGIILPYELFSFASDVPIVHGVYNNGRIDTALLHSVCNILEVSRRGEGALQEFLSEINYDRQNHTFSFVITDGGTHIIFGGPENCDQKLEKLRLYLRHSHTHGQQAKYVDLRWHNQIVVGNQPQMALAH